MAGFFFAKEPYTYMAGLFFFAWQGSFFLLLIQHGKRFVGVCIFVGLFVAHIGLFCMAGLFFSESLDDSAR